MNQTRNRAASQPPSQDDAERRIAEGLDRLDFARAEGLRRGAEIQATQAAGAARERDRLAAKYGPGHPRVRAAEARVAVESRLAAAVAAQADVARTPPPKVDADTWVVQGRVLRADGQPAAGLTVSLAQPGGGWERAAGHTCTDANGAFNLRQRPQEEQRLQLVVSDRGATLHRDPRLLTPATGTIDTRVIVLEDQAGACPPPEEGEEGKRRGDVWTVRGRVTDAEGNTVPGVTVSLYDQDLFFDDRLGQTTTNADGDYRFTYYTGDFRDFIERRPDLFVKVLDRRGRTLHTAPVKVRAEAGREEVIDVKLPRRKEG